MYGEHADNRRSSTGCRSSRPKAYKDAAGLTPKVVQAVRDEGGNMDDARGKKTMPPTQRARQPQLHDRLNLQEFDRPAYHDARASRRRAAPAGG